MKKQDLLRDYIAAHPGCRSIEAARAIGIPGWEACDLCRKMAVRGFLKREGSPATYTLVRLPRVPMTAEVRRERQRERTRRAYYARKESRQQLRASLRAARLAKAPDAYSASCNGAMVAGSAEEQAQAICSAEGAIDVYRFASGTITWRKRGSREPVGGEFVGTYDEGSDYRRVVQDLAA